MDNLLICLYSFIILLYIYLYLYKYNIYMYIYIYIYVYIKRFDKTYFSIYLLHVSLHHNTIFIYIHIYIYIIYIYIHIYIYIYMVFKIKNLKVILETTFRHLSFSSFIMTSSNIYIYVFI